MKKSFLLYHLLFSLLVLSCKKPYQPAVITVNYNYLVIDGVINATPNGISTIILSRTKNLADSQAAKPETGAQIFIDAENGGSFFLTPQGNGVYNSAPLNLSSVEKYRLRISTSNGSNYQSYYVTVKQTPPIDSLSWSQDTLHKDVTVFVHAHDPLGNTRFYRWDYIETYQYRSQLDAGLGLKNGLMYYIDSTTQQYNCWATANSTTISIATSEALSRDVISYAPVIRIPKNAEQIGIRYSANVRQYGLTKEAYQYWDILKKSTQQTGTIFDPQPSQILGNIHCITNPNEPVIGYVSASFITEMRLFIDRRDVIDWVYSVPGNDCKMDNIPANSSNFFLYTYADTTFGPYYFTTGFPTSTLILSKKDCLDCRRRGGTSIKPLFWK